MLRHDMKNDSMAEKIGIDRSTFSMKLNGKREFTGTEIYKMLEIFNCTFEQLFFEN